jgi:protein gp37
MINKISGGKYWQEGITLVSGCTRISEGCRSCWALAMEQRFKPEFKGQVQCHPDRLARFNTRTPKVFSIWNDLMHESVPDSFIGGVWSKMLEFPRHTFLILTKRPTRMAELTKRFYDEIDAKSLRQAVNIWHGLTVVNQQEADEKIPVFLQVPGKKFICHEPALEPIMYGKGLALIDGLISGAETGAGARNSYPDTFRTDREQCKVHGAKFFLKYSNKRDGRFLEGRLHNDLPWR